MRIRPGMTAVVTGAGSGSGIGLAVARGLAGRGCRLALLEVREDRLAAARASSRRARPCPSTRRTSATTRPSTRLPMTSGGIPTIHWLKFRQNPAGADTKDLGEFNF